MSGHNHPNYRLLESELHLQLEVVERKRRLDIQRHLKQMARIEMREIKHIEHLIHHPHSIPSDPYARSHLAGLKYQSPAKPQASVIVPPQPGQPWNRQEIHKIIQNAAIHSGVNPDDLHQVIKFESGANPNIHDGMSNSTHRPISFGWGQFELKTALEVANNNKPKLQKWLAQTYPTGAGYKWITGQTNGQEALKQALKEDPQFSAYLSGLYLKKQGGYLGYNSPEMSKRIHEAARTNPDATAWQLAGNNKTLQSVVINNPTVYGTVERIHIRGRKGHRGSVEYHDKTWSAKTVLEKSQKIAADQKKPNPNMAQNFIPTASA